MNYNAAIEVGKAIHLSDRLIRITAPNPGMMTGPGTNTYIVGSGVVGGGDGEKESEVDEFVVIDPGPIIDSHIDAIAETVGKRLGAILVTHTHRDHSPAAMVLKQRYAEQGIDVPCLGLPSEKADERKFQDTSFVADRVLKHGDLLSFGSKSSESGEFNLDVVYTPGHVSNHLCFLLKEENILIAGDHMMQGSTVAIVPPQGDMLDYLNSLKLLKDYLIDAIAPAHGTLLLEPAKEIDTVIQHRLWREEKVLKFISREVPIDTNDLLLSVYDDVDPKLHWAAKFSLFAHLTKLLRERLVSCDTDLSGLSLETIEKLDNAKWQRLA